VSSIFRTFVLGYLPYEQKGQGAPSKLGRGGSTKQVAETS
jgi:hypothetical protein